MRQAPTSSPGQITRPGLLAGYVRQVRRYRLITPLFGGGVTPQEPDPLTRISGKAVRGKLRFWWRACRGGQFDGSLDELRRAEAALWGAASKKNHPAPSAVQIEITEIKRGSIFVAHDRAGNTVQNIGHPRSVFSYVAFPLLEHGKTVLRDVEFTLTITFPEKDLERRGIWPQDALLPEIEAALWAWETFGGVGGRTRRGFGALQLVSLDGKAVNESLPVPRTAEALEERIKQRLRHHVGSGSWPNDVPHLSRESPQVRVVGQPADATKIWEQLIGQLRRFRQQRPSNSRYRGNQIVQVPGRNHWPEPDAIRALTGRQANYTDVDGNLHDHTKPIYTPAIDAFPRAAFGFPIQFEFKHADQQHGEPRGKNRLTGRLLNGTDLDRLASPLILRPIMGAVGAFGLGLILEGTKLPAQLVVEIDTAAGKRKQTVQATLSASQAAQLRTPTGLPLLVDSSGKVWTDIVRFFLEHLTL